MVFCVVACGVWLVLAGWQMRAQRPHRWQVQLGLALSGVPLLGLVTYFHGPLVGLFALACGTLVLSLRHLPRLYGRSDRSQAE